MIGLTKTMSIASAAVRFTLRPVVGTLVALAARSGASNVTVSRDDSERPTPVVQDVVLPFGRMRFQELNMPECTGCKAEREDQKKKPRQLTRLPVEVTQDVSFQRKGLPVMLCAYCDGDALGEAVKAHDKRVEK